MIRIEIPGEPVAQGRPRFARRGKYVSTYDPPKSRAYKRKVAKHAHASMTSREPLTGPLEVTMYILPAHTEKRLTEAETGQIRWQGMASHQA